MPLHFCLRSDARLSLTKSIQRALYHLLPQKSFRKLAKVCLEKDLKPGSRPDQRQQKLYLRCFCGAEFTTSSVFSRLNHPLQETREPLGWCQSKVSKFQQLQPVSGFIQRRRQSYQRSPAANPSSHSEVERPSHLLPGMMLHLNQLAVKSPPLSRTPETLHFKLGCYKQRPLGLRNCSGVSSGPCKYPASTIQPTDSSSRKGEYGPHRPGNTTTARERGYPCGPSGRVTPRVCEFNFSSPQKRGWPE